ncbi:VOC family protein [Cellulomonas sp. S1-8]|uniref:VOC family protein n=1 Tax=Cellulomonas sp. S1-8 TaxID=2904790 RepID=UPI002242E410|nr:VOC family protein [Cellulomonas sp. S1-8]UZN02778.1 VOC family protein [Cellulomonas sp. S1-8]
MSDTAPTHHTIDYIEIGMTDLHAAKAFYGAAFGWTFTDYGPGPAYVGIQGPGGAGGAEVGGFRLDDEVAPGGPLVLLYSADLEASVAAVLAAGGTVTAGPYDFPGGRRFHFRDPSGNELGVWATG